MTTERLTIEGLYELIRSINANARLIVHPDDEAGVRKALEAIPAGVRPEVIPSDLIPEAGTAYYSRAVPIEALGAKAIESIGDELISKARRDALARAEAEENARYLEDREPLEMADGTLIAGDQAAAYRRLQRRIDARVAREVYGDHPPIDPLDLFGGSQ
jgi:hypothetical protein